MKEKLLRLSQLFFEAIRDQGVDFDKATEIVESLLLTENQIILKELAAIALARLQENKNPRIISPYP